MTAGPDVLSGGADRPPRQLPRWARVALVVAVLAAAASLGVSRWAAPRDAGTGPVTSAVDAELSVVESSLTVSLNGVLVIPVRLDNRGPDVRILSAQVTAAPVLQDSRVSPPPRAVTGDGARLTVVVQPACAVIGPEVGGELVAVLVVEVAVPAGAGAGPGAPSELRLDLGRDPAVLDRVRGLCGRA